MLADLDAVLAIIGGGALRRRVAATRDHVLHYVIMHGHV
jgi:hypothetical protein